MISNYLWYCGNCSDGPYGPVILCCASCGHPKCICCQCVYQKNDYASSKSRHISSTSSVEPSHAASKHTPRISSKVTQELREITHGLAKSPVESFTRTRRSRTNFPESAVTSTNQTNEADHGRDQSAESQCKPIAAPYMTQGLERSDLDIGISDMAEEDLTHLLNPLSHFQGLADLESVVADTLGLTQESLGNFTPENYATQWSQDLEACITDLTKISNAIGILQDTGICQNSFSILVQDLACGNIALAKTIELHFFEQTCNLLEALVADWNRLDSKKDVWEEIIRRIDGVKTKTPHLPLFEVLDKSSKEAMQSTLLQNLSILHVFLAFGLLSHTDSHACSFDQSIFGIEINSFQITQSFTLQRRKLACLHDYIGGSVWIFGDGSRDMGSGYAISIDSGIFVDLWGPLWAIEAPDPRILSHGSQAGFCYGYRTERGLLYAIEPFDSDTSTHPNGLRCHWISTCKSTWVCDGIELGSTAGYYITGTVTKKLRRIPARTHKAMLVAYCEKSGAKLIPILKLRVGLEVSACTLHTRRVTLWEALRLSRTTLGSRSMSSTSSFAVLCLHAVGDKRCLLSCWGLGRDSSTEVVEAVEPILAGFEETQRIPSHREIIIEAIADLETTGVDPDDNLQAWWPYTEVPYTLSMEQAVTLRSRENILIRWIGMVKDNEAISTFAVMSNRCFEIHESHSKPARPRSRSRTSYRRCDGLHTHLPRSAGVNVTVLSTTLQLPAIPADASHSNAYQSLSYGSRLSLSFGGYLEIKSERYRQPSLAEARYLHQLPALKRIASLRKPGLEEVVSELVSDEVNTGNTADFVIC
ncbi:hypothetical protein K432DRAFT_397039 [Lepidopterella palustris CBS 459.81]|uniref:Uncharacterized protein n=1 Tax=Lepidopterella palustris CBS 459.81 TaxID=1314670 RepID=A0A8E2E1L2_9PEZI|nr:hypothetical protein K432DRAFT_397039 [Lepidopterella palustris CBS 459.81]